MLLKPTKLYPLFFINLKLNQLDIFAFKNSTNHKILVDLVVEIDNYSLMSGTMKAIRAQMSF